MSSMVRLDSQFIVISIFYTCFYITGSQRKATLLPGDNLAMSGGLFGWLPGLGKGGVTGIELGEAKHADQRPAMRRAAPATKNYPAEGSVVLGL